MRPTTLVIVAAVALIGLFAALDALRGTTTATSQPSSTREEPETISLEPAIEGRVRLQERLRTAAITGTLFVSDEDCRLRALSLPGLRWVLESEGQGDECEFAMAPDSRRVVRFGGGIAWSPNGRGYASCSEDGVVLYGRTGQEVGRFRGYCAPAWKPDGTLTLARGGKLVSVRQREQVILDPHDLAPALATASTPLRTLYAPAIQQAIWLTDDRVALVVRARAEEQPGSTSDVLAIFEKRRLVGEPVANLRFDELVASPSGRYLAVHGSAFRGLSFVDADGRLLARNPIASGHHVSWSPDERWTVVATGGSMYVFRTAELEFFNTDSRPSTLRIPVHAADVEWR